MTIQPFPINRTQRPVAAPQRRPGPSAYHLVLLSLGCNVLTLVVVAHLSWTLLRLVQR
jgi:hypothetical protein